MARDGGLRPLFRKHLPMIHWVSVESGLTEAGIPDANGCVDGKEFWVEHKLTHGFTVGLRPEQIAFHLRRARIGGRTFIAVRRAPRGSDELWVFPGQMAAWLAKNGLREASPRYCLGKGGPRNWAWAGFLGLLG